MDTKTGKIGVTTDNIFPVIKKFLYSDHEIFLRELVSNAIDATQKLRTLSSFGEYKGTLDDMNVRVAIDKEAGTLTVSDHGIGMTAEDIDKYINQIAFSGAEEFLAKYKDRAENIIGHFGLGFYSAFMVAKKVEIRTLSYKEGSQAMMWSCDGSPEYTMEPIEKKERGTDIVLYIDDDNKDFLEQARIDTLLKKYCRFLPVPVISGKQQEWKDGKMTDTDRDNVINNTEPAWTKKPTDLTDEDYRAFYRELYPGQDDPLFWIHLNVDYPFTLTGILYFPKIKSNIDINRQGRIQLYCNQVFVTDSVEGVVPEFMMLMQGCHRQSRHSAQRKPFISAERLRSKRKSRATSHARSPTVSTRFSHRTAPTSKPSGTISRFSSSMACLPTKSLPTAPRNLCSSRTPRANSSLSTNTKPLSNLLRPIRTELPYISTPPTRLPNTTISTQPPNAATMCW